MSEKKILYYINQFFGQIGGEEKAHVPPEYREEPVGPAAGFNAALGGAGVVVGTIICGDNYFNEHNDDSIAFLKEINDTVKPDIVIAGPAFNAGRYGVACAGVAEFFAKEAGIPVVSGMYEENPGLEQCRTAAFTVPTTDVASGMRSALPTMIAITKKIIEKSPLYPDTDGYFTQGKRLTVLSEKSGSERAMDMLLKRLNGESFTTELPMPVFDRVPAAAPIADLSQATIALVTTGGIVPSGNPDKIQSASAQKWGKYDVSNRRVLQDGFCTIHGGYDPVYANELPDRVAPLDILNELKAEGVIKDTYKYFYTTTGTGTAVGNSVQFGREIGKELLDAHVSGVILTST